LALTNYRKDINEIPHGDGDVRTDDVGQSAPSGITQPIFHLAGYVGDRQDWNEPDTNLSLPTMDDGALPTPSQDAPAMRLWADGSGVNNPHEFDALLGLPSVHVRINVAQEAELDGIRAASRALDVAGDLQVLDTTQNPTPTPLPEDFYSGGFDPDPLHLWTLLPYPEFPAPVQQRGTEQPQLSTEAQPSDTNIDQTPPFVCDLCPHIALNAGRLKYVLPGRTMVRFRQLTRSRKHKGRHTDKAFKHRCKHEGCGLGFQFPNHLKAHHDSHDWSLRPPKFPCEEECDDKQRCNKAYWRRYNLTRHKREKHPKAPSVLATKKARDKRPSPLVQPARVRKPKQKSTKKRAPKASSRVNGARNHVSSEQSAGQTVPHQTSLSAPEPSRTTYGVAPPTPSFTPYVSAAERESTYGEPSSFPPGPSSFFSAPAPQPTQSTHGAPASTSNFTPDFGTSTAAEWASMYGQPTFNPPGPGFSSSPLHAPQPDWMTYGVPAPTADYESYASTADWAYGEPTEPNGSPGPGSSSSAPRE
jgi:hypothetical protein